MKHLFKIIVKIIVITAVPILSLNHVSVPAADYPTKPVLVINPFSAGGSRDILGRMFASAAEKYLGKHLVVFNKPGASGRIGGLAVVRAEPDGYTLGLVSTSDIIPMEWDIANGRKPAFTRHDLILLGSLTRSPALVVVPYNSPWKTLADLVKDLKAKPNHYTFCSGGLYNVTHISTEILMRSTGTTGWLVPYKGGGECLSALAGEHVNFSTQFLSSSIPLARERRVRILAVMGAERISSIPGVPTTDELGIDARTYQMVGLSAPKGIPAPVVKKLKEVLKKVAEDRSFINMVERTGDAVRYTSADELVKYWDSDSARLAKLFKKLIAEKK